MDRFEVFSSDSVIAHLGVQALRPELAVQALFAIINPYGLSFVLHRRVVARAVGQFVGRDDRWQPAILSMLAGMIPRRSDSTAQIKNDAGGSSASFRFQMDLS